MKKPVSARNERALNLAAVAAFAAPSADAPPRHSVNTVLIAGEPLTLAVDRYAPLIRAIVVRDVDLLGAALRECGRGTLAVAV